MTRHPFARAVLAAVVAVLAAATTGAAASAVAWSPGPPNTRAHAAHTYAKTLAARQAAASKVNAYTAPHDAYNTGPIQRADGHLESGAVIRLAPTTRGGPYIHANGAHYNRGVRSIWINGDNGHLQIEHYKAPVVTMNCPGDESIGAGRGIITGVSGGNGLTQVRFYDTRIGRNLDLRSTSDYNRVASTGSNLWCHWVHVDVDAEQTIKGWP